MVGWAEVAARRDGAGRRAAWLLAAAGNLLDDGTNTYTYDALNRLLTVAQSSVNVSTYTYNGDGQLATEKDATGTTNYTLDVSGGLLDRLGATQGSSSTWYVRGWGEEILRQTSSGDQWFVTDRLGSVRGILNGSAAYTNQYDYDPFGTVESSRAPADYGFTGEPQNPTTGLVNLRARWYNTAAGRFQTHDPYLGQATDPMSLQRYLYASADPINRVDPWGLDDGSRGDVVESVSSAALGFVNELFDNLLVGIPSLTGAPIARKPHECNSMKVGRLGADVATLYGGIQEIVSGSGGLIGGTVGGLVTCPETGGGGCVAGAVVDTASVGLIVHGYGVCVVSVLHGAQTLGEISTVYSKNSTGGSKKKKTGSSSGSSGLGKPIGPPPPPAGPGEWGIPEEGRRGGPPAEYQEYVTGHSAPWEYKFNGKWFDGYDETRGVLLEAKDDYAQFLDPATGDWKSYWQGERKSIIDVARGQIRAAGSIPLEWHVSQQAFADKLEEIFARENIIGIKIVVHTRP